MTTTTADRGQRELHRHADSLRDQLAPTVRTLIHQAAADLYYGPYQEGEDGDGEAYPGFVSAMKTIRNAIDALEVDDIWVDWDCGDVMETEPQGYEIANPYWSIHDPDGDPSEWVEPPWETITRFDRRYVLRAMLGDLAEYL